MGAGVWGVDLDRVAGVALDLGGVLSLRDRHAVAAFLLREGLAEPPPAERFADAHYRAVRRMHEVHPVAFDMERSENWEPYDREYAAALGLDDDVWYPILSREFRDGGPWTEARDEAVDATRRLHAAGVPLAIVSNNDGTALAQLRSLDGSTATPPLPDCFAVVVDSAVVGCDKPDPAIFRPAVDALGIEPRELIYVGDTVYADVRGAASAGIQPVQLDPLHLHDDLDHGRCDSVTALANAILGAR